jgi:hypothetical protein
MKLMFLTARTHLGNISCADLRLSEQAVNALQKRPPLWSVVLGIVRHIPTSEAIEAGLAPESEVSLETILKAISGIVRVSNKVGTLILTSACNLDKHGPELVGCHLSIFH